MTSDRRPAERAPFVPEPAVRRTAFLRAVKQWLDAGGTIAEAHALIDRVAARLPAGTKQLMSSDQEISVPAGTPDAGPAGQRRSAVDDGRITVARRPAASPDTPDAGPAGQRRDAVDDGHFEPGPGARRAAAAVARASARAVLDMGWIGTAVVPGGPPLVELRWRDLRGMAERQFAEAATHGRFGMVLSALLRAGEALGQVDPEAKWVDTLPPDVVRRIGEAVEPGSVKPLVVEALRGLGEFIERRRIEPPGHERDPSPK